MENKNITKCNFINYILNHLLISIKDSLNNYKTNFLENK